MIRYYVFTDAHSLSVFEKRARDTGVQMNPARTRLPYTVLVLGTENEHKELGSMFPGSQTTRNPDRG